MSDRGKSETGLAPGGVTEQDAIAARDRIVASAAFRSAPQLAAFMRYIVNATLLGRQHEIKGYTIAVEALGRPDDFDPVADPIVRVEAGRLRRAMDTYYAGEGAGDPVRIVVERGSYVPRFERVAVEASGVTDIPAVTLPAAIEKADEAIVVATAPVVAHWQALETASVGDAASAPAVVAAPPSARPARRLRAGWLAAAAVAIAIGAGLVGHVWRREAANAPLDSLASLEPLTSVARRQPTIQIVFMPGADEMINQAARLYDQQLSDALSRFDDFTVLKATTATSVPIQPTYRIEFSAQPEGDETLSTAIRLYDVANGRVVFSGGNEFPRSALTNLDQVREVARVNAVRIAQPYGRIHSDLRLNGAGGTPVQCVVRTYDYWAGPSAERHEQVRQCLEATVKADPNYHPAWALLAMIHLDEFRIGYNPRPGSALDRARRASQHAVALAPESARALQSLMAVLIVSGETAEALKVGFEAVRRNPFDTDILADLGARLTQAGRAREGRPLLLRAAEVNRARPVWHEFYLYLSAREVGDADGARSAIKALELAEAPLALLAQAIAASDKGAREQSMAAMRKLAKLSPVFGANAGDFLDRAFFASDVRAMLLDALVRGGLGDIDSG